MIAFKVGNWFVTPDGIDWGGRPKLDYFIDRDRLAEQGTGKRDNFYDVLLHMAEKT